MKETVAQAADNLTPLQQALLDRADAIMDSMSAAVQKASSFAAEQVPDIALQYVAYGRATLTAYELIGMVMFIVGFWLFIRLGVMNTHNFANAYHGDWDDRRIGATISGLAMFVISIIVILVNMDAFIMVWVAPKIWLINEISHLVKH